MWPAHLGTACGSWRSGILGSNTIAGCRRRFSQRFKRWPASTGGRRRRPGSPSLPSIDTSPAEAELSIALARPASPNRPGSRRRALLAQRYFAEGHPNSRFARPAGRAAAPKRCAVRTAGPEPCWPRKRGRVAHFPAHVQSREEARLACFAGNQGRRTTAADGPAVDDAEMPENGEMRGGCRVATVALLRFQRGHLERAGSRVRS